MIEDLLQQAQQLATFDKLKPRQANLRRAISSAYYAVFHFLIQEACSVIIGTQHVQTAYRQVLGRAFSHSVMKQACTSFGGGTLKNSVTKGLPATFQIPTEIQNLSATFVELQEKRHFANYDLTERFSRSDSSDEKRFFLACLWAWKELTNR